VPALDIDHSFQRVVEKRMHITLAEMRNQLRVRLSLDNVHN
jgi:hypothetical protein